MATDTYDDDQGGMVPWENNAAVMKADINSFMQGFQNLDSVQTAGGGLPFLGLNKSGEWKYGQEADMLEDDAILAPDLRTAEWGYVAWQGGKVAGQQMVPLNVPRKLISELTPNLPWQDQMSVQLVIVKSSNPAEVGLRLLYKASSVGGVACFKDWANLVRRQLMTNPRAPISLIRLGVSSYHHKEWGQIFKPVFEIVGWAGMDALTKPGASLPPAEPARAGNGGGKAQTVPVGPEHVSAPAQAAPEPAQAAAKTAGRRRRVGSTG